VPLFLNMGTAMRQNCLTTRFRRLAGSECLVEHTEGATEDRASFGAKG